MKKSEDLVKFLIEQSLMCLKRHMRIDPELAWAWRCDIIMICKHQGLNHDVSERIAQDIMKLKFDVDVTSPPIRPTSKD